MTHSSTHSARLATSNARRRIRAPFVLTGIAVLCRAAPASAVAAQVPWDGDPAVLPSVVSYLNCTPERIGDQAFSCDNMTSSGNGPASHLIPEMR